VDTYGLAEKQLKYHRFVRTLSKLFFARVTGTLNALVDNLKWMDWDSLPGGFVICWQSTFEIDAEDLMSSLLIQIVDFSAILNNLRNEPIF